MRREFLYMPLSLGIFPVTQRHTTGKCVTMHVICAIQKTERDICILSLKEMSYNCLKRILTTHI